MSKLELTKSSHASGHTKRSDSPEESAVRGVPETPQFYRGKEGRPTPVSSNYLKLEITEEKGLFEYEVRFEPRIDSREQRFRLVNELKETTGPTKSFDGAKMFLPKRLNSALTTSVAKNAANGEEVKVTFAFKKERKGGERDVIQHYNILFNRVLRALKFVMHNRNFYDPKGAHHIKQYNLQVWPGYVTAVDEYEGGLLLQIDTSHRVLRTETVRDVIIQITKRGVADVKTEAEKALLGSSVLTRYNNKTYKIDDLDFTASPKSTFKNEKGEDIRFIDYYKNQYGIIIQDPDQPLIIHRAKVKSESEEEITKLICLVPELCMMTGMTEGMRADFKIMKEVGNFTRVTPPQRLDAMRNFLKRIVENDVAKAILSDWGLKISSDPISLDARLLPPPMMFFGQNQREAVGPRGDWSRAASNKPALTAVNLTKWAIFFTEKDKSDVQAFCKTMQQLAPRMGIQIATPKVMPLANDRTETYLQAMRSVIGPGVQMVMTVVPQQKSDRYAAIKKLCYVEMPVGNQVVCTKTIKNEKRLQAVSQKIILQMNCKLGGELWACQSAHKDIMVLGIDVFHDKSRKSGSIAGVVASVNDHMSRYYSSVAIQQQGQEMTDALTVAFMNALIKYYEVNHKFPQKIVVYRDGVSDGQMATVAKHEVGQFLRTFRHVDPGEARSDKARLETQSKLNAILPKDYNPGFNFIVVQKRINTRIFSVSGSEDNRKFDNPAAGTILDHTVTRRYFKDFFLVPQSVTQGTVSPTHFVVLAESGTDFLGTDDIQRLTYALTHMYFNWPGTVRVPAPIQYAHKMVDMVGTNLHTVPAPQMNEKLYFL